MAPFQMLLSMHPWNTMHSSTVLELLLKLRLKRSNCRTWFSEFKKCDFYLTVNILRIFIGLTYKIINPSSCCSINPIVNLEYWISQIEEVELSKIMSIQYFQKFIFEQIEEVFSCPYSISKRYQVVVFLKLDYVDFNLR